MVEKSAIIADEFGSIAGFAAIGVFQGLESENGRHAAPVEL